MNIKALALHTVIMTCISCTAAAQHVANIGIDSEKLGQHRKIIVYTPEGYDEYPNTYYDVIYVFDAQTREFVDLTSAMYQFTCANLNNPKQCIVVGIVSEYFEETDYARNNDMLPMPQHEVPDNYFWGYYGNADNFTAYVRDEVIPYIEGNYRTRPERLAVGHSLSASLVLYAWLENPGLFDAMICVSPNLAYDSEYLTDKLLSADFSTLSDPTFLFVSRAEEGKTYWQEWAPAFDRAFAYLDSLPKDSPLTAYTAQYPDEEHYYSFTKALPDGLAEYRKWRMSNPLPLSSETYRITIRLTTDTSEDVYIAGNQPALGDWQPDLIKMERLSDSLRTFTANVHAPCEIIFTLGSLDTQGYVAKDFGLEPLYLDISERSVFDFEIME